MLCCMYTCKVSQVGMLFYARPDICKAQECCTSQILHMRTHLCATPSLTHPLAWFFGIPIPSFPKAPVPKLQKSLKPWLFNYMETVANLPTAQPLDTPHLICHHYEAALFSRHGSAQSSQAAAQFQNQSEKRGRLDPRKQVWIHLWNATWRLTNIPKFYQNYGL